MTDSASLAAAFPGWLNSQLLGWQPPAPDAGGPPSRIDTRQMFGAQAYLVRGRMFAAVGPMGLLLKLPEEVRGPLLDEGTAGPFSPQRGASFGEWVAIPPAQWVAAGAGRLLDLVRQSFEYVQVAKPPRPPREARHFRKRMY